MGKGWDLKASIRSSLRYNLRNVRSALKELVGELGGHIRHGGDLHRLAYGKKGLLLNIGCGDKIAEGWLNLDTDPVNRDVIYFNALNPLPLEAGTVKWVHCEHFLEHLEFDRAVSFLAECHRVLEDGGTMRIVVPDAQKYMGAFARSDETFFSQLKYLGNASCELKTKAIICNQMFRMGGAHRFAWDFETLELTCSEIGFRSIRRSSWWNTPDEFRIDGLDEWRALESLYCELGK